jgi:hypothetical protein
VIFLLFFLKKLKGYFEYIQGEALRIKKKREEIIRKGKNSQSKTRFFLAHTRSLMNAAP